MASEQDWESLEDTYWYVPTPYLAAFAHRSGNIAPLGDQTLWHITSVVDGYVFGEVRTTMGGGWVEAILVGSIAPSGSVYFSFTEGFDLTMGIGRMVERDGDSYFEMQMTTRTDLPDVSHWANMAEVREGDRAWTSLPGFTSTGVAAAFDADSGNDAGAMDEQEIIFGTNGADQMDSHTSPTGLLLYGEGGADTLVGTGLADGLIGGKGGDTISGGAGADDLFGQRGNDVIKGQGGADLISGGKGDDTLSGNGGSDQFVFATGDGVDVIKDFDAKGGGANQDYIGVGSDIFATLNIFQYGKDTIIEFGEEQMVILRNVKAGQIGAADFFIADIL